MIIRKEPRKRNKIHYSSFEEYISKKEFQKGTPVWLNVYHLTWLNYILQIIGLGLYHTSIEINSLEYSFGASEEDVPGFYINKIGEISKILTLKEKIYMGNTIMSKCNIKRLLALESPFWMGRTYDPFLKNCNNFTKHFLKLILVGKIDYPTYINRICKYVHIFSSFYPPIKRLYGNLNIRDTCGSVSYLIEEINFFLKKTNNPTSDTGNDQSNISEKIININRAPINFDNLKNDEKYFNEKEKGKNKTNHESSSQPESNINHSSANLLDDEAISRINTYSPKLLRYMNKDPYLIPLNYSSIYKTQVQGKMQIDIHIESIYNFFKLLQETNDKLVKICNINPHRNSLFNINNFNINNNQIYQNTKYNMSDYNKLGEDIYICYFLLDTLTKEKNFHNKEININFETFIKDNMELFPGNLKVCDKLMNIETFLSLKILHMANFINFLSKKFERQKDCVEKILLIDQNEFYGLYSLAYIRLVELNIPEWSDLIKYMLNKKEIVDVPLYLSALNFMKDLKFN